MRERRIEKDAVMAAKAVQKKTGYNGGDASRYAEMLKMNIWYHDIGKVPAYYKRISRIAYIVLNERLDFDNDALINTIIGHEIGHYALNHEKASFERKFGRLDADYEEGEANKFAAALLMETGAFLETIRYNESIDETAKEFNVLPFLAVYKLKELQKGGIKTPNVDMEAYNGAFKLFKCG